MLLKSKLNNDGCAQYLDERPLRNSRVWKPFEAYVAG